MRNNKPYYFEWIVLLFALIFVCLILELLEGIFMVCGNTHKCIIFAWLFSFKREVAGTIGIQWYIEKSAGVHLNCF